MRVQARACYPGLPRKNTQGQVPRGAESAQLVCCLAIDVNLPVQGSQGDEIVRIPRLHPRQPVTAVDAAEMAVAGNPWASVIALVPLRTAYSQHPAET